MNSPMRLLVRAWAIWRSGGLAGRLMAAARRYGADGRTRRISLPCPATQPRLSACFRRIAGTDETKETNEPDEGSQAGDRHQAWDERDGHGVDEGSGRAADAACQ